MKYLYTSFLLLSGCITLQAPEPKPPNTLKLCAAALVTLDASKECTLQGPEICMFTMSDWERVHDAGANKQAYCPVLKKGEEAGNN